MYTAKGITILEVLMRCIIAIMLLVLSVALPTGCTYKNLRHPDQKPTMAQHLEKKTVALDHWMGEVGKDEDGDAVYDEVDPAKNSTAELDVYCSGVWINEDTILTAAHCVQVHKPASLKMLESLGLKKSTVAKTWSPVGDKLQYSSHGDIQDYHIRKVRSAHDCTVIAVDDDNDLAIVKASAGLFSIPQHEIATIASESQIGDNVHIMGHPSGLLWTYVRGNIAQVRDGFANVDDVKVDVLHISAPIWFGNSGGGAFNDNGELIGVLSFLQRTPSTGFFVRHTVVEDFLNHYKIKHTTR